MQFQVTQIEFDFTDDISDDSLTDDYKQSFVDETTEGIWEADDEDDLIDKISTALGWCIKSIDYNHIFS